MKKSTTVGQIEDIKKAISKLDEIIQIFEYEQMSDFDGFMMMSTERFRNFSENAGDILEVLKDAKRKIMVAIVGENEN